MRSIPMAQKQPKRLRVFRSADFIVSAGANLGDSISFADELVFDDCYDLKSSAKPTDLAIRCASQSGYSIDSKSEAGTPGNRVCLDSAITLMPPTGATIEALLLVEVDVQGLAVEVYVHPLAPLAEKTPYALVGIDKDNLSHRIALLNCVSFTRGTRITTETGAQKPVENLRPGDRILTRDSGIQELRWIGHSTVRAIGEFAPVVITQGTLHNLADLKVSQDHRLFIYQRQDEVGVGQAEVVIRAAHLVNAGSVYIQSGGYVDYFQMLFDDHQIIFAEGIAAETMLVTETNEPVLPRDMSKKIQPGQTEQSSAVRLAREVDRKMIQTGDAAAALRRASSH